MERYIDADALWMDIIHNMDYCEDILEFIEAQPTADVVEVVRCKDCKHRYIENVVWVCPFGLPCSEFFCSYGERKETEDAVH